MADVLGFPLSLTKGRSPVKKLFAMLFAAGLLSLAVGCPPPSNSGSTHSGTVRPSSGGPMGGPMGGNTGMHTGANTHTGLGTGSEKATEHAGPGGTEKRTEKAGPGGVEKTTEKKGSDTKK